MILFKERIRHIVERLLYSSVVTIVQGGDFHRVRTGQTALRKLARYVFATHAAFARCEAHRSAKMQKKMTFWKVKGNST